MPDEALRWTCASCCRCGLFGMELLRPVQGLSQSTDLLHWKEFKGPVFLAWMRKDVYLFERCAVSFSNANDRGDWHSGVRFPLHMLRTFSFVHDQKTYAKPCSPPRRARTQTRIGKCVDLACNVCLHLCHKLHSFIRIAHAAILFPRLVRLEARLKDL